MKTLVFDSSSIISLSLNGLLWTVEPLKELFHGDFFIPSAVKGELVDRPFSLHRFKLEALAVQRLLHRHTLREHEKLAVDSLLSLVNRIYYAYHVPVTILQRGEVEALALAVQLHSDAYVVDERTMRLLIEDPASLQQLLAKKLHTSIQMDKQPLETFKAFVKNVKVLRSTELMMIALDKGLFDSYYNTDVKRQDVADALLWGLRLNGCSISTEEIEEVKNIYR